MDSELNFTRQSNETIKLVSYKLYFLTKIKRYLNTDLLIRLHKAYIQPILTIMISFLKMQTITNTINLWPQCRCLPRCLPEHIKINKNDVYVRTGVNKLNQRADVHLLKLMYKRAQGNAYLNTEEVRTRLHDAPVLNIPFPNNETYKKSIIFRGSTAWNSLPAVDSNSPTFDSFKSILIETTKSII